MRIFQKGFNFSEDGPGNRLVYHVAGCNLRCRWCANPEGFCVASTHREISPAEILAEAERCRMLFFEGGGVTFTGGEVTLYTDELIEVLRALRERGIHTAIETNGTFVNFLDLSPEIQNNIIARPDPHSTAMC